MLVRIFQNVPSVLAMLSGSYFFELTELDDPPKDDEEVDRLAEIIRRSSQPPLGEEVWKQLREQLLKTFRRHRPSRVALYRRGMRHLCEEFGGKTRWVQFSTSCVFHAEEILELIPDARILFPLRNPFDVVGSMVERGEPQRILRGVIGWNRGVARARRLAEEYPDCFRIVRYEDLVGSPKSTLRKVFDFVDLDFEESFLRVPRVNPAESPHDLSGQPIGPDDSRVGLYEQRLTPSMIDTVSWLVDRELLDRYYPELSASGGRSIRGMSQLMGIVLSGGLELVVDHAAKFVRRPRSTLNRIVKRLS